MLLFFHCLLLPHCVCRLCIVLGGDCVVVSQFLACSHCVCRLYIVLGCDCVVVDSLFIAAPVCVEIMFCPGR